MDLSFCICGLGNPNGNYLFTRHNVGYMFVDYLRDKTIGTEWKNFSDKVEYSLCDIENKKICLIKPVEYMNNSGKSIKAFCSYFKLSYDKLIVVYDDVDIKLGSWKIKKKGSSGGHNGMKDIISEFGVEDIVRIRIGIGPKPQLLDLSKFVLSEFSIVEKKIIENVFIEVEKLVYIILNKGIDYAISRNNSL
ncbi:MAG: aminoacyl-tRNA hydrolase [Elusimicrobiales bacterium]|nr:aminoacyl-tRNA hydrolase [Elusimicrobiales bacterium]